MQLSSQLLKVLTETQLKPIMNSLVRLSKDINSNRLFVFFSELALVIYWKFHSNMTGEFLNVVTDPLEFTLLANSIGKLRS